MTGLFPDGTTSDIRLVDKIAELNRELGMRRVMYPRWVKSGKISQRVAHRQILAMEAILKDYEAARDTQLGIFGQKERSQE